MMLCSQHAAYSRRPRRPPEWRQPSVGIGVVSSVRPILRPPRAMARSAAWKPGPGVLVAEPPVARTLRWMAVNAQLLHPRAHVGGGHHRGAGRSLVAVLLHASDLACARGGGAARAGVGITRVQRAGARAGGRAVGAVAVRVVASQRRLVVSGGVGERGQRIEVGAIERERERCFYISRKLRASEASRAHSTIKTFFRLFS